MGVDLPTVAVAGETINSGPRARAFASYMRIHALEQQVASRTPRWVASRPSPTRPRQTLPSVVELTIPRQPWSIRNEAARRERYPEPLGDGNSADHRAEHLLHGRQTRPVRNRRRNRAAPQRHPLHHPVLRSTPPPEGRRAVEPDAAQDGPAPGGFEAGAGPLSPHISGRPPVLQGAACFLRRSAKVELTTGRVPDVARADVARALAPDRLRLSRTVDVELEVVAVGLGEAVLRRRVLV